jgi:hypothetical protein
VASQWAHPDTAIQKSRLDQHGKDLLHPDWNAARANVLDQHTSVSPVFSLSVKKNKFDQGTFNIHQVWIPISTVDRTLVASVGPIKISVRSSGFALLVFCGG